MTSIPACYLLSVLLPAMVFSTRQGYEDLEKQLKEVFRERSNILQQLSKTSQEIEGIKGNLQSLKSYKVSSKNDVQELLELEQKQREEMKSLQETFTKQLNEASEKAEKQQATINFLKTEMERKSKMIRDLQNEELLSQDGHQAAAPLQLYTAHCTTHQNKSLKNKLMSGNKFCGLRAEESKRIQAQLKELRYGKKDLVSKAQQLTDLEQKLTVAKREMEAASLDNESQLKALKETVQLCLSSVLHNQPPIVSIISSKPREQPTSARGTKETPITEGRIVEISNTSSDSRKEGNKEFQHAKICDSSLNDGKICRSHHINATLANKTIELEPSFQLHGPPWPKPEGNRSTEEHNIHNETMNVTEDKPL
ncbi:leucine zipper protein 2-like isoform X2 [Hyla sarda]|uniref:leucine zipper protein 2-like isoform X2 n=1 Tax=Hyla sarda TaxID=327740 RepID=UPI0024C2312B|nr:leucine zipper protein 2-like isoform X2 [Hyla sarda]